MNTFYSKPTRGLPLATKLRDTTMNGGEFSKGNSVKEDILDEKYQYRYAYYQYSRMF